MAVAVIATAPMSTLEPVNGVAHARKERHLTRGNATGIGFVTGFCLRECISGLDSVAAGARRLLALWQTGQGLTGVTPSYHK
jgi:hypothetical protein